MRKKVQFGRTMHCLPQRLKSMFFLKNFRVEGAQRGPGVKKKFQKNPIDVSLSGNCVATQSVFGLLQDYLKD